MGKAPGLAIWGMREGNRCQPPPGKMNPDAWPHGDPSRIQPVHRSCQRQKEKRGAEDEMVGWHH